jgi:hypothetical protein
VQQEDNKRICKNQLQAIQLSRSGDILEEEFPLRYLYGEALFLVKVSKGGCHQKVLIVLWGHTHLFGLVATMVIAGIHTKPEKRGSGEVPNMLS